MTKFDRHRVVTRQADGHGPFARYVPAVPGRGPSPIRNVRRRTVSNETEGYQDDVAALRPRSRLHRSVTSQMARGIDPKHGALPTNKAMALLSMGFGQHRRLWDQKASPREIESYLRGNASHVGRDVAMVFGGKPINRTGDWSRGDGHAFALLHIDARGGTITYTNPWNDTREHTMPITALARQAAGTGADFETVTFDLRAMTPERTASAPPGR